MNEILAKAIKDQIREKYQEIETIRSKIFLLEKELEPRKDYPNPETRRWLPFK